MKITVRKIFLILFIPFVSFFISLIIAEGIFRIFSNITGVYYPVTWTSPAIYTESKEGYSLLANKKVKHYSIYRDYIANYNTNTIGIRANREYLKNKPKNTKRIFILGDSLVFGIGVNDDETLAAVLEGKLNKHSQDGIRYEVFNLGVIGYTFDSCYVRLKRYLEFKPDLIIYVVAGVNDFLDILDHQWDVDENHDIVAVREFSRYIDQHNRFVNGQRDLYKKEAVIVEKIREFLRKHSVMYTFLGTLRYRNQIRGIELQPGEKNTHKEIEGIARSANVLDKIFNLVNNNQTNLIFIIERFNSVYVREEFLKYLSKKTNKIIDLGDTGKARNLLLPRDGHWSAFGSSYIAGQVLRYIKDNQIL